MRRQVHSKSVASAKSFRPSPAIALAAAVLLVAIGAGTVASMQRVKATQTEVEPRADLMLTRSRGNYVKVRVAGQDIHVDSQTGQMKPLSPQEAQKLAEGLRQMFNKSTEGLSQVHHPDGSVSMELEDRFHNVTVARINEDGAISQSCVDNVEAAASFFGIDQEIIKDPNGASGATQPNVHDRPKSGNIK